MTALLTTLVVAELVVLVLLSFLVLGLLRSHALILKSLHDLGAGLELDRQVEQERAGEGGPGPVPVELERGVVTPGRTGDATAPQIIGADLGGAERSVDLGGRTLLAFLTTGCSVCAGFWSEFRSAVDVPGGGQLLVVTKGDDEESPSALAKAAAPGLDIVRSGPAWGDYDIPGSPYFVYVDAGRVIGEGSATTWAQVSDLMAQALGDDEHRAAVADGYVDRGDRDDPTSVDAELLAAGIGPDHPSLRPPPRPGAAAPDHGHEHG